MESLIKTRQIEGDNQSRDSRQRGAEEPAPAGSGPCHSGTSGYPRRRASAAPTLPALQNHPETERTGELSLREPAAYHQGHGEGA